MGSNICFLLSDPISYPPPTSSHSAPATSTFLLLCEYVRCHFGWDIPSHPASILGLLLLFLQSLHIGSLLVRPPRLSITPLWSPDLGLCLLILCWGFPCSSIGKESACNAGERGSIPGLGRSPGEGKGYPLQYSGLENPMDYTVCGVPESRTGLATFTLSLCCALYLVTMCIFT